MALLTPPNSPNTLLVQVPLPQPVASPPQQANQPAQPQPQAKPAAPAPKPDPFKKVKGPPAMIIPHTYQPEPSREQMQRKRKSIKFSREDVEAILPNVQAYPNDHASRGALADALEESGLHHDEESLDHLRAFDRPVYGMKHPESGKYVFSPRRRWLLGEALKHFKNNYNLRDGVFLRGEHFGDLSSLLRSFGLNKHADFLDIPTEMPVEGFRNGRRLMKSAYLEDSDFFNKDIAEDRPFEKDVSTSTPHGFSLTLSHPVGYTHNESRFFEDLNKDFQQRRKGIAQEHQEMNEEDKLYSNIKKKEQLRRKKRPTRLSKIVKLRVQFSRSAVKSLLHQIGDDPKAKNDHHRVMTDALEESGSGTLGRLIRSYIDGNKTNQHVEWLHTDGNPLHGLVDQRTMFPAIVVDHFGKHGDFHVFHESDHDGDNGKHLLHFIHDDSYHTGHPQIRYQFEFHPHDLYQFAHDLKNDESFNVDGEAGNNLVDRLDYWIEKSGEAQAKQPTEQESVPFNRPVKFKLFERLGNVADFVASSPVKASNLATDVWNKTGELYTDGELFSTIGRGVDKAAKGIWHGGLKWGQALAKGLTGLGKKLPLGLQGPAIKQLPKPDSKPKQPVNKPKKRKSLAQPFNPTKGDWKEEHLFGDHPVRSHLERYRNTWTGHSDKKKDRIGRLADKALQGYWYSSDVKGANVFHEIQRQLKNIGHKDADKIDWSGHHDELVQKIKDRKKAKKTKMSKRFAKEDDDYQRIKRKKEKIAKRISEIDSKGIPRWKTSSLRTKLASLKNVLDYIMEEKELGFGIDFNKLRVNPDDIGRTNAGHAISINPIGTEYKTGGQQYKVIGSRGFTNEFPNGYLLAQNQDTGEIVKQDFQRIYKKIDMGEIKEHNLGDLSNMNDPELPDNDSETLTEPKLIFKSKSKKKPTDVTDKPGVYEHITSILKKIHDEPGDIEDVKAKVHPVSEDGFYDGKHHVSARVKGKYWKGSGDSIEEATSMLAGKIRKHNDDLDAFYADNPDAAKLAQDSIDEAKNKWAETIQKFPNILGQSKDKPEQMAKFRSPAGGIVVRGQFYPGGKMLPLEATQTNPPPDKKMAARKKNPDSLAKLREFFKTK